MGDGIVQVGDTGLELDDPAGGRATLAEVPGPVLFSASPGGERLAVLSLSSSEVIEAATDAVPAVPPGVVSVIDRTAGTIEAVTRRAAVGLWWSPDGRSLLLLSPGGDARVEVAVWRDGETRSLGAIELEPAFVREVLPFFDQYAQSLRLWSPDSAAVALPGIMDDRRGVWVMPVDGGEAFVAAGGTWVSWSG